jgi:hypothetical protein
MNSVQERIAYWRGSVKRLSLRDFRDQVNAHLPETARVSLGTINNYERVPEGARARGGPRAEFLLALKRAFPEIRLDWLLLGQGEPTELAQRLAFPEENAAPSFANRILERYPDLELLAPEASALFMGALTRYAMGEPKMALDEGHLLDLAGDLRWLLLLPLQLWGFQHEPSYEDLSDYAVALLHAVTQLMPGTGEGDAIAEYGDSLAPKLRSAHTISLGG